jgi:hypothetical protein
MAYNLDNVPTNHQTAAPTTPATRSAARPAAARPPAWA